MKVLHMYWTSVGITVEIKGPLLHNPHAFPVKNTR